MFWEYSDCFLNLGVSSMLHHRFQAAYIILESAAHFLGVESSIHIFWWVIVLEILDISCYWLTFGFWTQIRADLNSAVNISYWCLRSGMISFVKTCWIYLQCSLVKLWSTFRLLIWRFVDVKIHVSFGKLTHAVLQVPLLLFLLWTLSENGRGFY